MEFAKTSKELRAEKEEEIRRRLLNWPDCFYRERDPEVRRSLLDEAEKEGLTPEENGIRRKIFELRYPKSGSVKDNFLKAWLDLRFAYTQKGGLFGGRNPKKVTKPLDEIGFAELGEDSLYRSLLYQELYHLGMLYASLCLEDNLSRLQKRVSALTDDPPATLHLATIAGSLAGGLCDQLVNFL